MNNDGTVYGVDDVDAVQTKIAQRLDSNIKPSCLGLFDIHVERCEDKRIIKVVVSAGSERPYYLAKYVRYDTERLLLPSWRFMPSDARKQDNGSV